MKDIVDKGSVITGPTPSSFWSSEELVSMTVHLMHSVLIQIPLVQLEWNVLGLLKLISEQTCTFFSFKVASLIFISNLIEDEYLSRPKGKKLTDICKVIWRWKTEHIFLIYISCAHFLVCLVMIMLHSEILSPPNFNAIYDLLPGIGGHWYI